MMMRVMIETTVVAGEGDNENGEADDGCDGDDRSFQYRCNTHTTDSVISLTITSISTTAPLP